jgi:acyl carrier protein
MASGCRRAILPEKASVAKKTFQDTIRRNSRTKCSIPPDRKAFPALPKQSIPSIQDRVLKVIATSKHIPLESVQPDSSFESLAVDSLDRLNILFDLESEFDIEINDEDAKEVKDIREMIEGVTKLVEAKNASAAAE